MTLDALSLEHECETLREENSRLRAALMEEIQPPAAWRLTHLQVVILRVLMARRMATRAALEAVLYGARGTEPRGEKALLVHISQMRSKLAPLGVSIACAPQQGYFLSEPDKALLRQCCDGAA
ncbi:helix-turn-helix domain-containing protein [Aquabacter sp. CN5-332]|uniref:helix-turn-helix domain-containing protein n=1 Tax=Aquabacter sp. CN5-332 TaxID=3156608 RepID=UPI0032B4F6B7